MQSRGAASEQGELVGYLEQTSPAAKPKQAKDSEVPGSFEVSLFSPKCTFLGNSRGEKPAGVLALLSALFWLWVNGLCRQDTADPP